MHILHVITGLPKAAGTTTFIESVVCEQRSLGHTVDICTIANQKEKFHRSPSPLTFTYDIIHIHGLWSPLLHKASCYAARHSIPVIWSTHGMTAPWALHHKWWKKFLPWHLYQRRDLRRAALIHCTTDLEVSWNHSLGFPNTFIAPLGTTLPAVGTRVPSRPHENENSTLQLQLPTTTKKDSALTPSSLLLTPSKNITNNQPNIVETWYDVVDPQLITGLSTINVSPDKTCLADRRAIKDVFQSFGTVKNIYDGRNVIFPAKSAGKMLGQRGIDLRLYARSFATLFTNSRRAWSESEAVISSHRVHRNITAYHQYIAKAMLGGECCYVRFTIREDAGSRPARNEVHSSTVSRITVYKAKGAELSNLGHAQAEDSAPFVDNKISYFLTLVNGGNENFPSAGVRVENAKANPTPAEGANAKVPETPSVSPRTLLFVGRIYPVKALDNAIRALAIYRNSQPSTLNSQHPLILRIVGPDQANHKAELISLCESLGIPYSDTSAELENAQATPTQSEGGECEDARAKGCGVIRSEGGWRDSRTRGRSGSPIASEISLDAADIAEGNVSTDSVDLSVARAAIPQRTVCASCLESPRSDHCVHFIGPRFDKDLDAEYDNCDALILVSHTENFGATVVDAMAHAKPVITSTNTPWSIVQGNTPNSTIPHSSFLIPHSASGRCGWWVDNSPESLAKAFSAFASASTSDLNLMGQNGLALVKQSYTWPAIARNLIDHYQSLTTNH